MQIDSQWMTPLAAVSGISFSVMAIAYRLGAPRRVTPSHILLVACVMGMIVFGTQSLGQWSHLPSRVVLLAATAGVSQFALLRLMHWGLKHGPLSPLWCALMLGFIPVILYSAVFLGEALAARHYLAVATATGSVLAAAFADTILHRLARKPAPAEIPPAQRHLHRNLRESFLYASLLMTILLTNAIASIVVKELSTRTGPAGNSDMNDFRYCYLFLLYLVIELGIVVELACSKAPAAPRGSVLALGTLAGAGTIAGMITLTIYSAGQAATVFTVSGVASIVATSVGAVLLFGEKMTLGWLLSVGLGLATVVIANL